MIQFALKKNLHTANGEMPMDVDCHFEEGKFISLYGPSGAGKTSILRMLAGLMKPDEGYIKINGEVWFDSGKNIHVRPQMRKIGLVFQDYALFPNMNVRENIHFAIRQKDSGELVDELLDLTGLQGLASRNIQTLSGGQQQRVALARAIAGKPGLLLLDEPLSAIDHALRLQLQQTLREVHKRFNLTSILVSHDMDEIIRLSDAVIHLEQGRVCQVSAPAGFFQSKAEGSAVTGHIIAIENNGKGETVVVLLNNRILKVDANGGGLSVTVGEKVEIRYEKDGAIIRKL